MLRMQEIRFLRNLSMIKVTQSVSKHRREKMKLSIRESLNTKLTFTRDRRSSRRRQKSTSKREILLTLKSMSKVLKMLLRLRNAK